MDVPKAFDTINHKLQITNSHKKYKKALKEIISYI